jgi:hypothetical protein
MSRNEPVVQTKSLDAIFEDFDPQEPRRSSLKTGGAPVTIWIPVEYKAKYDRLQEMSKKRFCKKVRELIQAAIDRFDIEAQAS